MPRTQGCILVVDDEIEICHALAYTLEAEGLTSLAAHEGKGALALIRSEHPDAVLLDVKMPGVDGMDVLRQALEIDPDLPIVMITAYAGVGGAVEAMKAGARDYLSKPFRHQEVVRVVRRVLEERDTQRRRRHVSIAPKQGCLLCESMGPSSAVARLSADVSRVARSGFTVVILGETGAGKELAAQAIHQGSLRSEGPFVPVDCGAIPEALFESELFGNEKGAFTGADARRIGKLETAQGGTLLLDEISNMPFDCQAKLMRVLQDRVLYRVGGTKPVSIDVRVVAASNEDLQELVNSGKFRQDLFFRLNEFTIRIPPLRQRKEDIVYLAKRFLDLTNAELKKNVQGLSEAAVAALLAYDWPGNVRQLRSTIRRAVLLAEDVIRVAHLDLEERVGSAAAPQSRTPAWDDRPLRDIVRESTIAVERHVLCQVLARTAGNKAEAARLLHVDYKTIHSKVKEYGITGNGGD